MPIVGGTVVVNYPAADTGTGLAFAMYTARKAPMLAALGGIPPGLSSGQWEAVVYGALVKLGASTVLDEVALVTYFLANLLGGAPASAKNSCRVLASTPIFASGLQTIDGIALSAGDRVWRTGDGIGNGAWVVASGAWARAVDMGAGTDGSGSFALIEEGTLFAGHMSVCTSPSGKLVDIDALTFNNAFGAGGGGGYTPAGTTSQVLLGDGSAAAALPTGLTVGGESLAAIKAKADAALTSAYAPSGTASQVLLGTGAAGIVPRAAIPTAGVSLVGGIALPGASTGKFLKDDGTFAAPAGGGGGAGYGTYAARPAAGTRGALYYCTNSPFSYIDNGVSWDLLLPGVTPLGGVPAAASWTLLDPGGAADGGTAAITPTTLVDGIGVVTFAGGVVGVRLSTATVAYDATKTYILGIRNTSNPNAGVYLVLQQGSDSGAEVYAVGSFASNYNSGHWMHLSNRVAYDYSPALPSTPYLFFKAAIVGGNYVLSYGTDGATFSTVAGLATIPVGGAFTPTRIGFGFMAYTSPVSLDVFTFDVR